MITFEMSVDSIETVRENRATDTEFQILGAAMEKLRTSNTELSSAGDIDATVACICSLLIDNSRVNTCRLYWMCRNVTRWTSVSSVTPASFTNQFVPSTAPSVIVALPSLIITARGLITV